MFDFRVLRQCFIFYNDSGHIKAKSTDTTSHLVEVYLHLLTFSTIWKQVASFILGESPVAHWVDVRVGSGTGLNM
jgi:hypothetical protein